MRFKFERTYERNPRTDTCPSERMVLETEAIHMDDLLQAFTQFLKGCGFEFEGEVGIVEEEE